METNENVKPSVMSTGLKFGVILGVISVVISIVRFFTMENPMDSGWLNTVITLIIGAAAVFFAHKAFKENGDGFMTYGQGLGIGVIAILISTVISGLFMFIYFNFIDPSVYESLWNKTREQMEEQGQSEEAIEMGITWGRNLFWIFFAVGGAFWGLIIGLVVSIFTQKPRPETAY